MQAYNKLLIVAKYLHYYFTSLNGKGHGIHSPFVYDFTTIVLNDKREFVIFDSIENKRKFLLNDDSVVEFNDLGASGSAKPLRTKISSIAKKSLKSPRLARFLFRLVNYYKPQTILELGTSLGITTAYLASGYGDSNVFTIEGSKAISDIAKKNFSELNLFNSQFLTGNFDDVLPSLLPRLGKIDLAFIDGNHRFEPTVRYFNQLLQYSDENTILIFDDIHWSKEMEAAWGTIKENAASRCTIDLFFAGIVFFKKEFKDVSHFTIRY